MTHLIARQRSDYTQQQQAYTYILTRVMGFLESCGSCGGGETHFACWNQQPVPGAMPTQTVYLPEQLYQYVITTTEEDQSTSARVSELVQKGKEVEA